MGVLEGMLCWMTLGFLEDLWLTWRSSGGARDCEFV